MVLKVTNLQALYNNHIAIDDINFSIEEGEYVCIVGENGSGKSTLIKVIMGLKKQTKGDVKLNINLNEVSYLAQADLTKLDFPATVKEIIMTGTQKHNKLPFYTKKDKENFNEIIQKLDIENIINKRIGDLSGGQKQRVFLARCLIKNPKLIILDEPFSGLDAKITKELYDVLWRLNKDEKVTIIMATHDIEGLKNIKPRIISLATKIKYDGDFENWLKNVE